MKLNKVFAAAFVVCAMVWPVPLSAQSQFANIYFGTQSLIMLYNKLIQLLHQEIAQATVTLPATIFSTIPSSTIASNQVTTLAPTISSVSPAQGPTGATVTIRGSGFTPSGNDVHFGGGGIQNVLSSDGLTLKFAVPSTIARCLFLPRNAPCPSLTPTVQPGAYRIYVVNTNGMSNSIVFTVTDGSRSPPF